jgi:peptidoglycan/LPS O-acetylase OafA/YrhL
MVLINIAQRDRFAEVDVLRGLAALAVVFSHYTQYLGRYYGDAPFEYRYGFEAVLLFFTISGFVIYFTLQKCATVVDFAVARATRLYPTYVTALLLMTVVEVVVFGGTVWWGGLVANLTMFQEFIGYKNLDNVFWSLTVEVAFYLNMAALFATGLLRRPERVAAVWLALSCAWALLDRQLGITIPEIVPRLFVLPYSPFFVAGIVFYRIVTSGLDRTRTGLLLAALATEWWLHGLYGLTVAAIVFGIFGLAVSGRARFLVSRLTLWLGAISFPLYVSHRNIGYATIQRMHDGGVSPWFILVVTTLGALILGAALCYSVERPALRALRGWYRSRTAATGRGSFAEAAGRM